jgi:hypothetical protein
MSDNNDENINNEEEINSEITNLEDEKSSNIEKPTTSQIPTKVNKTPSFPNQNRFGK